MCHFIEIAEKITECNFFSLVPAFVFALTGIIGGNIILDTISRYRLKLNGLVNERKHSFSSGFTCQLFTK